MKLRALLLPMLIIAGMVASGQRSTLELTFTAENNGVHVQLDSIRVMNRTQGGFTMLYWPDTVLLIYNVGISEMIKDEGAFRVFQNYPNPVAGQTTISLYVPAKDKVSIMVTDILGRVLVQTERVLDIGKHSFRFTPGSGSLYFFTAQWKGQSSSVKILQAGFNSSPTATLEYTGSETSSLHLKAAEEARDFVFSLGDTLLCIGYAEGLQSGFLDAPEEDHSYTFDFATNIPCPATPMVEYEGQVYNTIQLFGQCWLKENLNVGVMIPTSIFASNNGIIEKYCYNYEPDSCAKYGGLYQWDEMMDYLFQPGTRGICPPGWHIPTDDEWKILEGTVDSQYGIDDPVWDFLGIFRGNDAGTNLKTTTGWYQGNNGTDSFNYSGMPAGYKYLTGYFYATVGLFWWSSTQGGASSALDRHITYNKMGIARQDDGMGYGLSVRCLRDEPFSAEVPAVITAEVTAVTQTSAVCGGNVLADGGAYVTARGVVWSQTEHPTIENNQGITHNGTGTGEFVSQLTFLMPGTEYFVRAYATNSQGTAYGEDQGFTTSQPAFNCGTSTITDIDGNVYNTLLMGSQCWMKENLKVGTMINGTQAQANNGIIEKYCYDNITANCEIYGGLYQWNEAMQYSTQQGVQGICPQGWHFSTDAEWTALTNYISSNPDYWCNNNSSWIAKSLAATTNWNTSTNTCAIGNNQAANNATGFTAPPGGLRDNYGDIYNLGLGGYYWSSTQGSATLALTRYLLSSIGFVDNGSGNKVVGFSVRCLRD